MSEILTDIDQTILNITDDPDGTAEQIKTLRVNVVAAIAAAHITGSLLLIIGPAHLAVLLSSSITRASVFQPVPVIPLDENGDPLPALPSQGPCGTLDGTPLFLDPLADTIGVGLRN